MVVFWDHGNGWQGYGADGTCPGSPAYADHTYCDVASMNTLVTGGCCHVNMTARNVVACHNAST
jgi:hypothetical protein